MIIEDNSEMVPADVVSGAGAGWMRLPECDSSTCVAWHTFEQASGRHLFIKQLRPEFASSLDYRNAFIKEFHMGQKLESPYFPKYHHLEDSATDLSITMDFIEGDSLKSLLESDPRYFRNGQNLLRFIRQSLEAMDAMHQADIIHLDLKPSNILITKRSNNVRIVDFGLSYSGEWSTTMGMTQTFTSPEQLNRQTDKIGVASDIYSFGRIVQHVVWKSACKLPRYLRNIVNKCLEENPEDRYSCARQILDEMDAYSSRKSKQILKVSVFSTIITSLLFLGAIYTYFYYTQTEFEDGGLRYAIMKDVWVSNGMEDVVELRGKTDDTVLDSIFRIPNTVTFHGQEYKVFQVGDSAFVGSPWIKKVIFPQELRFSLAASFLGCKNLEEIDIQENVAFVRGNSFADCPALRSIKVSKKNPYLYFDDDVLYLRDPFVMLMSLMSKSGEHTVPEGVKELGISAFSSCKGLTHVIIPSSVNKIRPNAFDHCSSLLSVEFPDDVVDVENSVLHDCTSLQSVTFGKRSVILGHHSLENCKSLKKIVIPETMIRIGGYCFAGCDSLDTIVNLAPEPQDIAPGTFTHFGNLYVPSQSVEAYRKATEWSKFKIHPIKE